VEQPVLSSNHVDCRYSMTPVERSGSITANRWTTTVSVSCLVAVVFCLQMASARWKCLVQKTRVIPPASQRELEQRDNSATFAFTITSVEGSFQKARVKACVASAVYKEFIKRSVYSTGCK